MNILVTGVGGQGTILASKLLAQGAINMGLSARTTETIGMAQRGGSVVSHIRIGDQCLAPAIPMGEADLIIGFEPGEAVRYLPYLREGGKVVVSTTGVIPIMASFGHHYSPAEMVDYLKANVEQCYLVDGEALCEKVGSSKVLNVILLAVAAQEGLLPYDKDYLADLVASTVKPQFVELNQKALDIGFAYQQA